MHHRLGVRAAHMPIMKGLIFKVFEDSLGKNFKIVLCCTLCVCERERAACYHRAINAKKASFRTAFVAEHDGKKLRCQCVCVCVCVKVV